MSSLTLQKVLEAFNAPINEEQAWAVCHQCCKYLAARYNDRSYVNKLNIAGLSISKQNGKCSISLEPSGFYLSTDGTVERISICNAGGDMHGNLEEQIQGLAEAQLVRSVGVMIFQALDYGLSESEEQKISSTLEQLIERMTDGEQGQSVAEEGQNVGRDCDGDEGIEDDDEEKDTLSVDSGSMTLDLVIKECVSRAEESEDAGAHYRAVCRALVAEAHELMSFLEKIYVDRERLKSVGTDRIDAGQSDDICHLESLNRTDWARLWIQLMKELRQGVNLKKVKATITHPVEYELTPYEILMDDLRYKRYTLHKIPHEDDRTPPMVKKDVHAIILEFIRSRPPLHPAGDRKLLSPPVVTLDIREQMLTAIRSDRPQLRPTARKTVETSRTRLDDTDGVSVRTKKVIKPDLSLLMSNSFDDEHNDNSDDERFATEMNRVPVEPMTPFTPLSPNAVPKHLPWQQTDASTTDSPTTNSLCSHSRRHSITVCQSPTNTNTVESVSKCSQVNCYQSNYQLQVEKMMATDFPHIRGIKSSLECLSLTVEEVMHIRNVLTKAELECLMGDAELYKLLAAGKICFACKKTKFSLFGTWATTCKFCFRNVCSNCISKMRIPTEHFEHVPVYTLSPSPDVSSYETDLLAFNGSGSVPASPDCLRAVPMPSDSSNSHAVANDGMSSLVSRVVERVSSKVSGNDSKRAPLYRAQTMAVDDKAQRRPVAPNPLCAGPLMNVCRDCRSMIVSIIRASRRSLAQLSPRRGGGNKERIFSNSPAAIGPMSARDFHLDLKPLYREH